MHHLIAAAAAQVRRCQCRILHRYCSQIQTPQPPATHKLVARACQHGPAPVGLIIHCVRQPRLAGGALMMCYNKPAPRIQLLQPYTMMNDTPQRLPQIVVYYAAAD